MNRKRRWQSAADRARVAADLMAEAESLTEEAALASPAEVEREHLPPPLPLARPLEAATVAPPTPAAEPPAPPPPQLDDPEAALAALDAALGEQPDECTLLVRRAGLHAAAGNYVAAQHDLEHTLRVVGEAGLTKVHVFPYSPRPGTGTAAEDPVPPHVKKERSARLRGISHAACLAHWRSKVGCDDVVLVDRPGRGYGDDYSPWLVPPESAPVGELVRVRGAAVSEEGILAA